MTIGQNNLIPNHDFQEGELGTIPEQWTLFSPQPYLTPNFHLVQKNGKKILLANSNGDESCVGWLSTSFPMEAGKTYRMSVRFHLSEGMNPHRNLLFSFWTEQNFNDGIFQFKRLANEEILGEGLFEVLGNGLITGEVRIAFRLSADGEAWINDIGLEVCESIPQRNVKVACVGGQGDMKRWKEVLDAAGHRQTDMILLPETFRSSNPQDAESLDGISATLMSQKAKQYRMYVAGTFLHRDAEDGHVYNTGLIFDREGRNIGRYDKNHTYSPEFMNQGISPGRGVPVFQADFGTVGMMICYDSWFTDVAELLALQGAEIVLFPNAGYYRSLMPARANDNGVRIVCSSLSHPLGVWDTSGADVEAPNLDPTRFANNENTFRNVEKVNIGDVSMLFVTLDLSQSPSAHNWGGPMLSAPGGRRNRREQLNLLLDEIKAEINRW